MLKEYFSDEKYEEIKNSGNLIYKALEIVSNIFKNDIDKGGHPYILHLIYVYRNVCTENQKIIALLHDVIEDKNITYDELLEIGFPKSIVDEVLILSKPKSMDYRKYIDKLVNEASFDSLMVKIADLENNMDMTRIKNPTLKDWERVEKKYTPSYEKILNRIKEMEN